MMVDIILRCRLSTALCGSCSVARARKKPISNDSVGELLVHISKQLRNNVRVVPPTWD